MEVFKFPIRAYLHPCTVNTNSMEQELMQICRAWDKAIAENDLEKMTAFVTDDWVLVGADGITEGASFHDSVRSGILLHTRMDFKDVRVKVYDHCAVVTSLGTSEGKWHGQLFSMYEWASNTFMKQDGKWKCVLTVLVPAKR